MTETQIRDQAADLADRVADEGSLAKLNDDERAVLVVALKELSRTPATSCNGDDEPTTENPI